MTKETEWLTGTCGKQYQKGAVYELSDDGEYWVPQVLMLIRGVGDEYPYRVEGGCYKYIRECQAPIGKIKEPEIVPEEGCWYLCLSGDDSPCILLFKNYHFRHKASASCSIVVEKIIKKVDV